MATPVYTPIEEKAKGKSNLFKFVSLRSPNAVTIENKVKFFISLSDFSQSVFLQEIEDVNKFGDYLFLKAIAADFDPYKSVEELKIKYLDLFKFSDWLIKNKEQLDNNLDITTQKLGSEDKIIVWNNLYYFLFTKKSKYLLDNLLRLLVTSNFIENYKNGEIVKDSNDLKLLASAKVVIPRVILTQPPKKVNINSITEKAKSLNYNPFDQEKTFLLMTKLQTAKDDLLLINEEFIGSLSNFDNLLLDDDVDGSAEEDLKPKNITVNDILKIIGNPLDVKALKGKVSLETLDVITDYDLSKLKDPLKAIDRIDAELKVLNKNLFKDLKLSKKLIVAGSSIIEFDKSAKYSSKFTDGCFPTITNQKNIFVDDNLKQISSDGGGAGNSGGSSENSFSGVGSISFEVLKFPPAGTSFYVGLSHEDTSALSSSIKYSIRITSYYDTNGVILCKAFPIKGGSIIGSAILFNQGDEFKISRVGNQDDEMTILWQRLNKITGSLNNMAAEIVIGDDATESLLLDFSFSDRGQSITNVLFYPCKGDSNGGDDSDVPKCSGITNLGVSDYMRVEQEVCCYLPGEVSHIENIMQGEYKERSTRRLIREETTITTETETTTEKLRDTTTTDRYEMEQETSQVIQEDSAFDIGVTLSTRFGPTRLTVDSGFASSTSSVDSNSQAVTYAQEVSSRALDRVVNRVREERITKVIEEYEENNLHGLDNRNNPNGHVTGIYRWVDKIYKNQVVNYGKRLTFEFMIPEPAKFHLWAMATDKNTSGIDMPLDPRENGLPKHTSLDESNYALWTAQYGVEPSPPPALYKTVSKAYHLDKKELNLEIFTKSYNDFQIPDGYVGSTASVWQYWIYKNNSSYKLEITVGNESKQNPHPTYNYASFSLGNIEGTLPIGIGGQQVFALKLNVVVTCLRKQDTYEKWRIETFNKIIDAYEQKKAEYDNDIASNQTSNALGIEILGNNPLYNRTIEQQELKKGCLSWLEVNYGNNFYDVISPCSDVVDMPSLNIKGDLACYTQSAKFFEQAFDWDIISYLFYPYFWGKKCSWREVYKLDDNDGVFRGFLQAGMARVIVPVKPNYEEAVMYYLETKEVWSGGEPPIISDPLYEAIAFDLSQEGPTPVGDSWETRVPSSLNILQKDSAAVAGDGLPCSCDNYDSDGTGGSVLSGHEDTNG